MSFLDVKDRRENQIETRSVITEPSNHERSSILMLDTILYWEAYGHVRKGIQNQGQKCSGSSSTLHRPQAIQTITNVEVGSENRMKREERIHLKRKRKNKEIENATNESIHKIEKLRKERLSGGDPAVRQ